MKILFVNTKFLPDIGGPVIYLVNVARELKKMGHSVDFFVEDSGSTENSFESSKIIRYEKPEKIDPMEKYFEAHRQNARVEISKLEDYDLIITRSHIFLEPLKERFAGDKIIYVVPALMGVSKGFNSEDGILKMKKEIKESTANVKLVFPSRNLERQFKEKISDDIKSEVISNGCDIEKFKPNEEYAGVLSIGRITPEKNIEALIEAFSRCKTDEVLTIVGDGPSKDSLMEKAGKVSNKIIFEDKNFAPEKKFSSAKVFVLPSKYESFGITLIEAMASGVPAIAFRPSEHIATASDEIIKNGETGFLVDGVDEIAEKIDLLLEDDLLREKMGKAAREAAMKYTWGNTAEKMIKFAEGNE